MKRLAAVFFCALGSVVVAQVAPPQSTQPPPSPQVPAFRTRVDLIHLDVSVLNKDRSPVRGLTPADFTVTENGKPQQVTTFVAVDVPTAPAASAPWVREIAPDVRTNLDHRERRLFIIAIDDATIQNNLHAVKAVKDIARSVLDKFGPTDLISVVYTRDSRNSQDFTADRRLLAKAIDAFTGGFRDQGKGLNDIAPNDSADDLWYLYSVGMLERAVDYLSDVPERRKSIIYIGQGVPFDFGTAAAPVNTLPSDASFTPQTSGAAMQMQMMRIKDQLIDLFDRAQRANVTVYTVDPCGVRQLPPPRSAGARVATVHTCVPGFEVDYLVGVAGQTGGRAVVNNNDFEPGVKAIFDENSSYYLLGYQSTDQAQDGKFRKLEVKVNRPDVIVRTRTGYDAPRAATEDKPRAEPSPLGTAIAGVLPKSDLPMQIMAAPFMVPGKPEKDRLETTVAIAVGFRQPYSASAERIVENVELQVAAFNTDGRSFGNTRGQATVAIRPNADGPAEYEVFTTIDLKPGRYQLRLAANVGSLSTAGSVYYDVEVPDFSTAPLSMSGLLLTATPGIPFGPKEGLGALVPIVPTTRRAFGAQTHKVSAFARVYQGGNKPVPVTVKTTVRDAKDAVVFERTQQLALAAFGSARAADLSIELPISTFAVGPHVLTVEATAGAVTVKRDSRFQIK